MSKKRFIPKGSKLFSKGEYVATIINDLPEGYLPLPKDFDPEIPLGTSLDDTEVVHEGKVIYRHPNFV